MSERAGAQCLTNAVSATVITAPSVSIQLASHSQRGGGSKGQPGQPVLRIAGGSDPEAAASPLTQGSPVAAVEQLH